MPFYKLESNTPLSSYLNAQHVSSHACNLEMYAGHWDGISPHAFTIARVKVTDLVESTFWWVVGVALDVLFPFFWVKYP